MEKLELDWNAGVTSKHHKSGIWVNMQKSRPGIFLDNRGGLISDVMAREAGFNVKKLKKFADRKAMVDKTLEEIDTEFSGADEREILFEKGDYKVVAGAGGNADIFDIDDNIMNTIPMKKGEAMRLAGELTKDVDETEEAANQAD